MLGAIGWMVLSACNALSDAQNAAECVDVCAQVDSCAVEPPTPSFGALGAVSSGEDSVDCAVNCAAEDRALKGYSDCQQDCIVNSECGDVQDCWDASSAVYEQFCLAEVDVPDLRPPESAPPPTNGSESGSEEADELLDNPAVAIAVDESEGDGFVVNYGETPPVLEGRFHVVGTIDSSSNARPEGSPIDTTICFRDYSETDGGVEVTYCEDGVPGNDTAPLTGTDPDFTAFFEYPGQATVLFSGAMNGDGTLSQVEALVVYTYATDVWELSHTDWTPEGDCSSCN